MIKAFGEPTSATPGLTHFFPTPEVLAGAKNLVSIGLPVTKMETIRSLARAVCDGTINFNGIVRSDDLLSRLCELPGIKTILLDDIFGFDPDVRLAPTNTFHLGFWFDNPEDAAALPSCHFDPTKPTPFNGVHKAGPFAMLSVPDAKITLGPLCTDANNSTTPASCNAN